MKNIFLAPGLYKKTGGGEVGRGPCVRRAAMDENIAEKETRVCLLVTMELTLIGAAGSGTV